MYSSPLRISRVVHLLLRQRRGAAVTTRASRSSTYENDERHRRHRPRRHDQVPATQNGRRRGQRPGYHAQLPLRRRGQRPGATMKYLRRTTSAAAGNGLGTTINEHSPAMYNERGCGKRPGHHDQVSANKWAKAHIHRSGARIQMNPHVVLRLLYETRSPTPGHVPQPVCV